MRETWVPLRRGHRFGPRLLAGARPRPRPAAPSRRQAASTADQQALPLLDLADLTALLKYLTSEDGKPELKEIGSISSQTAGVLLRKMVELEQQDAELLFGEPVAIRPPDPHGSRWRAG
ncbi:MAG: helicase HerA-like domain-containing protein [Acidimicrobiales bacterium]